jgi:hypothetical protein
MRIIKRYNIKPKLEAKTKNKTILKIVSSDNGLYLVHPIDKCIDKRRVYMIK